MNTIATEAGLSDRRAAQLVVRRLEEKGLIVADTVKTGGRYKTTHYRFDLEYSGPTVALSTAETATAVTRNSDPSGTKQRLYGRPKGKERSMKENGADRAAPKYFWDSDDPWWTSPEAEAGDPDGCIRQQIWEQEQIDAGLAEVLFAWRRICPFNQDADYVFGSLEKKGQQPYWPTAGMEDHIRPAAKRAGITKRIGWHTFRHTFGTLVKSQGADVATTKELMRHANVSITMDRYVQAIGEQKRQAQHSVVGLLAPDGPTALTIPPASC